MFGKTTSFCKRTLEPANTKLLAVIEQTPYKAYSLSDLTPYDDNLLMRILLTLAVQSQLKSLEEKELVKSKNIKGITYYVSVKAKE